MLFVISGQNCAQIFIKSALFFIGYRETVISHEANGKSELAFCYIQA